MKVKSFLLFLLCLTSSLCFGADDGKSAADKEKESAERQRQIQIMGDRISHKFPQFSLLGPLEKRGGSQFAVNGEIFSIDKDTKIQGELQNGSQVEARGFLYPGKPKVADQVVVLAGAGAPSQSDQNEEENQVLDLHRHPGMGMR